MFGLKRKSPLVSKRKRVNTDIIIAANTAVQTTSSTDQLSLSIPEPKVNKLYAFKQKMQKISLIIETMPYWRNFLSILATATGIAWSLFVFILILANFSKLPAQLPLFYDLNSTSWNLMNREYIVFMPFAVLILTILMQRTNSRVFAFDRRLTTMINSGIVTFNVLGIIATSQLFSLLLIY